MHHLWQQWGLFQHWQNKLLPLFLIQKVIPLRTKLLNYSCNNLFLANVVQKLKEYKRKKEYDDGKEMEKQDALRKKNNEKHKK